MFVFEEGVGFFSDSLGFFLPPFALLDDQVFESDDEVVDRVGAGHFVGFPDGDPHVEAKFFLPPGDHFVVLGPYNREEEEVGEGEYREVFAGHEQSVIVTVD